MILIIKKRYTNNMLPNLDTDLLRAFVAVADNKSFTRAGQSLYRTQSAVSMQIKRLEQVIDRPLFHREGREVRLTGDGEMLLGYARRMLRLNDEVMTDFMQPDLTGTSRIGMPDDYAAYLLPELMILFTQTYPRIQVEVICDSSLKLISLINEGKLDLAVVARHIGKPGGEFIRREPVFWAGSQHHCIHERDPLPVALFQHPCPLRELALQALSKTDRRWYIAYTSHSCNTLQSLVTAGLAVTVLERCTLPKGLRVLEAEDGFAPLPAVEMSLYRTAGELSEPVKRLSECIMKELSEPLSAVASAGGN